MYPQTEAHGLLGPKSLLSWRVSLSVAHGAAILSSIFRLYRRKETGHFGIDDHFALGALLLDCAFFPTLWMAAMNSKDVLIAAAWLSQLLFIPLLWGARISLAFSISRFIPAHQKTRKAAIVLVYIFAILCVGFLIQISVTCAKTYNHWSQTAPYQCPISTPTAIVRIIECACDVALVFVPFYAFWGRLKLTVMTRRFIQACFGASLITAVSTLLIAGILFSHHNSKSASQRGETGFIAGVMSHLAATISLFVCNLLVVATSFYRFFRAKEVVRPVGEAPQLPPIPLVVVPAPIAQPQSAASSQNEIKDRIEGEVSSTSSATRDTMDNALTRLELTEIFLTEFTPSDSTVDPCVTDHDACSKKVEQ